MLNLLETGCVELCSIVNMLDFILKIYIPVLTKETHNDSQTDRQTDILTD